MLNLNGQFNFALQAINRAGLESLVTSTKFIFDSSPPHGGHVMDGTKAAQVNLHALSLKGF